MNNFVEFLRNIEAWHVLLFLIVIVSLSWIFKGQNRFVKWHRKKLDETIVSHNDPDNIPDIRAKLVKDRIQVVFAIIAIIGITFIATVHSIYCEDIRCTIVQE